MIGSTLHNPSIRLGTSQQNGNKLLPFQDHQGRGGGGGGAPEGGAGGATGTVQQGIQLNLLQKFLEIFKKA